MINGYFSIPDAATERGRAMLHEQYRSLSRQIPLMYAIMAVNSASLSAATFGSVSPAMSLGIPALLCLIAAIRSILWLRRREEIPEVDRISRYLRGTIVAAAVLSFGFGGWGLLLFDDADLVQRACIGLFIFIGAISCSFCLQTLPAAGRLVLLCGAAPMTVQMLASGNWLLIGLGINVLFVGLLNYRILNANFSGFEAVLSSRSDMVVERERSRDAEQRAHRLAYHDPLTGLQNRRALGEYLDAMTTIEAAGCSAGLLIVDLDRFKSVNDVHGHLAGDNLLGEVSARLIELVGHGGQVFRLGGDEFAVVVETDENDPSAPHRIARRIVQGMNEPFPCADLVHHIGASVGIALYPEDALDRETLMRRADIALYQAKEHGRGQFRAFEPLMDAELKRRSAIERQLRGALAADAFRPAYQPLVELAGGRTIGFELLARWWREGEPEIGPDQFIPIAEECGLINELMLKLLGLACAEALTWDPSLTIAVNISPVQLKDPWLSEKILAELARLNFPPRRLAVEITENALIVDADNARRTIQSLKNQGVTVALDDFGTGYSSLQHLRMLPFDKIKIDRTFIGSLGEDPEALKIVRAITSLALSLNLPVVAEGIEDRETAERLRQLGCAEGQGYYFGRPMAADQVHAWLNRDRPEVRSA